MNSTCSKHERQQIMDEKGEKDEKPIRLIPGNMDTHPILDVLRGGSTTAVRICAHSWCRGECGLPTMVSACGTLRVHGTMVARGRILQPWRIPWLGERLSLTAEETAYLCDRFWC